MRKARRAVIQDSDLFPGGTITINEVRAHSGYTPEKLLSYAVAITDGYGMEISKLLAEALREQYGRPARATNIKVYDMGGLSGEIGADTVLVGTAAYMARMGMPVQAPKKGRDVETGIYVVINGQPAGVIQLTYHSNAQTFSALQALLRLKVTPELATRDFNISPEMVQKMFETRRGRVGEIAADRVAAVTSSAYTMGDRVCALLSRDGIVPFAQGTPVGGQAVRRDAIQPDFGRGRRRMRVTSHVLSGVYRTSRGGYPAKCAALFDFVVHPLVFCHFPYQKGTLKDKNCAKKHRLKGRCFFTPQRMCILHKK